MLSILKAELLQEIESLAHLFPVEAPVFISGTESGFLRYFISKKNPNLLITINLEEIEAEEPSFTVAIELAREALRNKEPYKQMELTAEEKASGILFEGFFRTSNRILAHIAYAKFQPTSSNLAQFSTYVHQLFIDKSFYTIFVKLEKILLQNKDTSSANL